MDKKKRPAELLAQRLRMSSENPEVMEAMDALRRQKKNQRIESEITAMLNPTIYYN